MLSKNTIFTIATKFIILLANFALVVFSTRIWGSEGRGEIALVLANVSIISIFSNIVCGSTVAYHAPRLQREFLLLVSLTGALLISISGALVFSALFRFNHFLSMFLISLMMSLTTAISTFWLGKNNITKYNRVTILSPVFIPIFLAVLFFLFNKITLGTYFQAYYAGTGIALCAGIAGLWIFESFSVPEVKFERIKSILTYGFNNEFSYLIQFLNYRLSYYFIARLIGLAELGVFSIVISVSEAVWIISRSMSAIHFSNVINSDDQLKSRNETIAFARQSLSISLLVLGLSVLIPKSLYQFIFGDEFWEVKKFIILLIPGIVAIAVSNLYGHYFAGTGKLNIVRNKSLIGLAATLILLPLLISKYKLTGVCISLNVSYILSSFYLWFKFMKEGQQLQPEIND
jgi:O-antigen/teichoic acid export membrane protein